MKTQNPECCGSHCIRTNGEVRVYPLGGGGNLFLCRQCWSHENSFRADQRKRYRPQDWPHVEWITARVAP